MRNILFMILFLCNHSAESQQRGGFEQYYFSGCERLLPSLSMRGYYQSAQKWYTEIRYNYEEAGIIAVSAGKTFSVQKNSINASFTPVAGFCGGKRPGAAAGLNTTVSYKSLAFTSSLQYTSSLDGEGNNQLYSWSELDWQLSSFIYVGATIQQTWMHTVENNWEPGLQIGFSFKNWTFPFYVFNPASGQRYFAAGICREWKK